MTAIQDGMRINAADWAMELLDNQPEPVVLYLPVWSEVDATPAIIDFEVGYSNKEAIEHFQILTGQLLSQQVFTHFYTDSSLKTIWFNQLLQVFQTREKAARRYYDPQSGQHFNLICTKVKDGVLSMARDITREMQAKKEKERQVDLVSSVLNATISGLFALEAIRDEQGQVIDFHFVKVNEQFLKWIGKKEAEVLNHTYLELLPLSRTNGLFELKCLVIATGETIVKEFYYEGGGIDRWYQVAITRLGADGIVQTFTDITESKKDKEQVVRLAERFQTVIGMSQSGIMSFKPVKDVQGEIVDFRFNIVNQATASYIGETAEALKGGLASKYFPAYKKNGLFEVYSDTYLTGTRRQFDFHYEDGYDVFFNIQVAKLDDEVLVTLTDHTTLQRTQRDLEASINDLRRSNASLEQFAHAASHDLQEPLRKILLYTDKLEEQYGETLDDEGFGFIERIKTAGKRMRRLIQDLLIFAEVGANRNPFEEVPLNALIQEVVNDLEVAIAEREAKIEIGLTGTIKGDPLHLQQLFQNLISNSLKYSRLDVAPCITITLDAITGTEVDFDLPQEVMHRNYWLIQVKDNGQGFTSEQATQIFKIFQRLPQHRAEYSGTGIGLAIVQRVVESHNGYIRAEGVLGEGATFKILLPVV
jgi:signal transduction histidine kinase